jgi:hypothetical protein
LHVDGEERRESGERVERVYRRRWRWRWRWRWREEEGEIITRIEG